MIREAEIHKLMPVAERIAGQFVNRHGRMTFPEALSSATLGVIEAIDSKDRTNSVPLEAWAVMKARWQIGQDFRATFAPRRRVRSEVVSIEQINPIKFVVVHNQTSEAITREEIDAAIQAIKPLYQATARAYFYGPTQNIVEIAKQSGTALMTCKRAVWAVRRELRRRMESQ